MADFAFVEIKSLDNDTDAHNYQRELPDGWTMYDGEWYDAYVLSMHITNEDDDGSVSDLKEWCQKNDPEESRFDILHFQIDA